MFYAMFQRFKTQEADVPFNVPTSHE